MEGAASEDAEALVSPSAAEADMSQGEASAEAIVADSVAQDVALHPTKVDGCGGLMTPCWDAGIIDGHKA